MGLLTRTKEAIGSKLELVGELVGLAVSVSGATVAAVLGKLIVGAVLAGVAVGFVLRLKSRKVGRQKQESSVASWVRPAAAALAVLEVAVLVEAVDLPVRLSQEGFQYGHWYVVGLAFFALYLLQSSALASVARKGRAQGAA